MYTEPLDVVPLGVLFAAAAAVLMAAVEGGYRVGRWRHVRTSDEKEAPVGAMVGTTLGLLAFLLAFSFGMAANRYDARRQAVLEEANAIGTTYLRAGLLPEPHRAASARLLREYVDVRVRGVREGRVEEAVARSEELHGLLWTQATKAAESDRGPITGLYIQSLNQVIDTHAVRVHAGVRSRIPAVIWVGLAALALLSMAAVGYQSGLSATRRSPAMAALVVAFAGVLFLIADLDRPGQGFLTAGQQAMTDLQAMMDAVKP